VSSTFSRGGVEAVVAPVVVAAGAVAATAVVAGVVDAVGAVAVAAVVAVVVVATAGAGVGRVTAAATAAGRGAGDVVDRAGPVARAGTGAETLVTTGARV
jgi:hypothetical protein